MAVRAVNHQDVDALLGQRLDAFVVAAAAGGRRTQAVLGIAAVERLLVSTRLRTSE
jgi:predicted DNA-binding protein (UPF0278 family)